MKCLGKCKTQAIANNLKVLYIPIWIKKLFADDCENSFDKSFEYVRAGLSKACSDVSLKPDASISSELAWFYMGVKIAKDNHEIGISVEDFVNLLYIWFVSIHESLANKLYLSEEEECKSKSILCCVGEGVYEDTHNFDESYLIAQFPGLVHEIKEYLPDLFSSENEKRGRIEAIHPKEQPSQEPKQTPIEVREKDDTKEQLFETSKELIKILGDFIEEGYDKKFVVGYFESIIVTPTYKTESRKLVYELSHNRSQYEYNGLKVMHFCHIIGFLIKMEVIKDNPIEIARKLTPKLTRYPEKPIDGDVKKKRTDTLRLYIQDAKDFFSGTKRKIVLGNKIMKQVFDDMQKKSRKKPQKT